MVSMYKKIAKYYDLIYHWKDYENEAHKIKELIKSIKIQTDRFLEIMIEAGFKVEFLEDGLMKERGLYIGIKS